MKRLHIHLSVDDLQKNITFYSTMFGMEPSVIKDDYVKWVVNEPAVNFAISNRDEKEGLNHLGIQTDNDEELETLQKQLETAQINTVKQEETACCYAESNKHWSIDPQGIPWECFNTLKDIPTFGDGSGEVPEEEKKEESTGCCAPTLNWDGTSSSGCC